MSCTRPNRDGEVECEEHNGDQEASSRTKLLTIRPGTLDRLLRSVRKKHGWRGLSETRSGEYLSNRIPVKISHEDDTEPGFIQADTVAHCGGSLDGDFVWSLTFTDCGRPEAVIRGGMR